MKKPNKLIDETSPYLLQHAYNPVEWYPWCDEALSRAKAENKLIFLSIGYSSCHWCHVMEHESFEDDETARLLNEKFINIKADREERPDLDAVYMEAVQMMTGQGGWPLNVWLTPEKIPVFGGTYFPFRSIYGKPDFKSILIKLAEVYEHDPENVKQQAEKMAQALKQDLYDHIQSGTITQELLDAAFEAYQRSYEPKHGGFSPAPKFPSAMGIEYLLQYYHATGNEDAKKMALHSLDQMIMGGIYDQVGGGFHRYSTDSEWLVPHFEKMLYDNALLISALCDAWQVSKNQHYKTALYETFEWVKRDMTSDEGGFYSALDADTEGEEGKYYVWQEEVIDELLSDNDLRFFKYVFSVSKKGNWEGKNILHRTKTLEESATNLGVSGDILRQSLKTSKLTLLKARNKRTFPGLDDKVITSWNSMMLKSLCKCYKVFGDESFRETAVKNSDLLITTLIKDDSLHRTYTKGMIKQKGFLDDYALCAEALCYVFEITGDEKYLDKALLLVKQLKKDFFDEKHNAFFYTSRNHESLISSRRDVFDNATPSGNSAACAAFQRVGSLTGSHEIKQTASKVIEGLSKLIKEHGTVFGYALQTTIREMNTGSEIIIVGEEPEPFRQKWADTYDPFTLYVEGINFQMSSYSTLKGKNAINKNTTAYVCREFSCSRPIDKVSDFDELIAENFSPNC